MFSQMPPRVPCLLCGWHKLHGIAAGPFRSFRIETDMKQGVALSRSVERLHNPVPNIPDRRSRAFRHLSFSAILNGPIGERYGIDGQIPSNMILGD